MPLIIIALFLVVGAVAIKPTQTSVDALKSASLIIEYPKFGNYKNDDIGLNFHVHNSTSSVLNGTEATCLLHIYNESGNYIVINQSISYDSTENAFEYTLKKNLISNAKEYAYIIYCNSSSEHGFVSDGFSIKEKAAMQEALADIAYILGTIISIIIIYFCIYLIAMAFHTAAANKEEKLKY